MIKTYPALDLSQKAQKGISKTAMIFNCKPCLLIQLVHMSLYLKDTEWYITLSFKSPLYYNKVISRNLMSHVFFSSFHHPLLLCIAHKTSKIKYEHQWQQQHFFSFLPFPLRQTQANLYMCIDLFTTCLGGSRKMHTYDIAEVKRILGQKASSGIRKL